MFKNIKIKTVEAKDIVSGAIPKKYRGSLDWSPEVDYIQNNKELKVMFKEYSEGVSYSDDFITVTFKYKYTVVPDEFYEDEKAKELLTKIEELEKQQKEKYSKSRYKEIKDLKSELGAYKEEYIDEYLKKYSEEINKVKIVKSKELKSLELKLNEYKEKYKEDESKKVRLDKKTLSETDYKDVIKIKEDIKSLRLLISNIKKTVCDSNKKETDKYITKTDRLRLNLYKDGFKIGDTEYVRYKRSSGSSRVGKCLFVNKKYYERLIEWSFCGIDYKNGKHDLAALEAYISLPLSSAINKFQIKAENILVVSDVKSKFKELVLATEYINNIIVTTEKEIEISNNLFDGESLLDKSIFEKLGYDGKADLQIRNQFFKGTGVRCNIQQFYKDNNITEVTDMFGNKMKAEDVLLITTPSSVKYLKYGTLENWIKYMTNDWYVCKYEKPQQHFNRMVQTHYQLLNSIGMTKEEIQEFLIPTIDYITKLKRDDDVFIKHLKLKIEIANNKEVKDIDEENIEDVSEEELQEEQEIIDESNYILTMVRINKDFIKSAVFREFRKKAIDSYIKNVRKGHVLVNGNYSIVANNVLEMLYHSISELKYNEELKRLTIRGEKSILLNGYEVISSKFKNGEEIMAVRSPQPTMSNVLVYKNIKDTKNNYYYFLNKYFYLDSKEVIYTNSIKVNRMEKASSEDSDGDAELLTNNKMLVEKAKQLQVFKTNNDLTPKESTLKEYTAENLAALDSTISVNKIGEIINLSQCLNSCYWKAKNDGKSEEYLDELFKDISTLNALSCVEIDRAKKLSPIKASKELNIIRKKPYLETTTTTENKVIKNGKRKGEIEKKDKIHRLKPEFFKYCNEFKIGKDNKNDKPEELKYISYGVGMDLLEEVLDEKLANVRMRSDRKISLVNLLMEGAIDKKKENRRQISSVLDILEERISEINKIFTTRTETGEKIEEVEEVIFQSIKEITSKISKQNIARIIYHCEKYIESKKYIKDTEKILKENNLTEEEKAKYTKKIKECEKYIQEKDVCKYYRLIFKILFKADPKTVISVFKLNPFTEKLTKATESDTECEIISLYDVKFKLLEIA